MLAIIRVHNEPLCDARGRKNAGPKIKTTPTKDKARREGKAVEDVVEYRERQRERAKEREREKGRGSQQIQAEQAASQAGKQAGTPFCSRYALSMGPRASSPRVLRLTRDRWSVTRILPTSATPSTGFTLTQDAHPHPRTQSGTYRHVAYIRGRISAEHTYVWIHSRREEKRARRRGGRKGKKRSTAACTPHASPVKKLLGSSSRAGREFFTEYVILRSGFSQ